jgi:hypothetical protein
MIKSLVWESMLSQAFIDIRKKYSRDEIDDCNVWGISELTAIAIHQTDFCASDWKIGYRELAPRQDAVKKLYKECKNRQSYLDAVVGHFKNDPLKKEKQK